MRLSYGNVGISISASGTATYDPPETFTTLCHRWPFLRFGIPTTKHNTTQVVQLRKLIVVAGRGQLAFNYSDCDFQVRLEVLEWETIGDCLMRHKLGHRPTDINMASKLTSQTIQPKVQMSLAMSRCPPFKTSGGAQRNEQAGPVRVSAVLDAVTLSSGSSLLFEGTRLDEAADWVDRFGLSS